MATPLLNFEPPNRWVDDEGRLTERAQAFLRRLFLYIGANTGQIPVGTIGGDGVTTTTFLREDGTFAVPDYPVGANPSAQIGVAAVNGSAPTFMRSDAAPALNSAITPTWAGLHTFGAGLVSTTTIRSFGGFGCNGASPQTSAAVGAAVAGTAGAAYTATEQGLINAHTALLNQIRAALVANGIAV